MKDIIQQVDMLETITYFDEYGMEINPLYFYVKGKLKAEKEKFECRQRLHSSTRYP